MHVPGLPPKLELRPGQGYLFRIYMRGRTPCSPEVADMVVEVPFDTEGQQAGGGREITLTPLRSPTVDDMAPLEENFPGAGRIMRRYLLQGRLCVPEVADLVEERILFETSPGQWERWAGREAALQPLRAPKGPQDFLTDDGVISGTVKEVLDELSAMSEIDEMTPELLARVGEAALSTVPESVQDDIPSELMTRAGDLTTVRSYWLDYRPCTPEAANRLEQVTLNSEMEVVDSSSTPLTPQVPISAEHTAPELEEYALGFVRRSYFLQSRPCVAEVADVCVERLSLRFGEGLVPKSVSRTATMPPLRAATPADMKASNYETEAATASDAPALYDGLLANAEELLTSGATVEQIREDRGVKLLYMGWRENALGEDMTPERAARTQRILSALGL